MYLGVFSSWYRGLLQSILNMAAIYGELCVTQISIHRDLTHMRETGQIECWCTLAIYVVIHNAMLPTLNSHVTRKFFLQTQSIKYLRLILWHHYAWPLTLYPWTIGILYVYVILLYHRYISMWSLSNMTVIETCVRQSKSCINVLRVALVFFSKIIVSNLIISCMH